MSRSTIAAQVEALSASIDSILNDAHDVDDGTVQMLAAAAVRLYASKVNLNGNFAIVPPATIPATDAMIVTSALLRAVNVQLFELGLWQSWSSNAERAAGPVGYREDASSG
jgi:hypothetical protein